MENTIILKIIIWPCALIVVVGFICITLLVLNSNPYEIQMDENTLEAVKAMNSTIHYHNEYSYQETREIYKTVDCIKICSQAFNYAYGSNVISVGDKTTEEWISDCVGKCNVEDW